MAGFHSAGGQHPSSSLVMYCFLRFCNSQVRTVNCFICLLLMFKMESWDSTELKSVVSCMGPRSVHKALCVQWNSSLWESSYSHACDKKHITLSLKHPVCTKIFHYRFFLFSLPPNWAADLLILYFSMKHKENSLKGHFTPYFKTYRWMRRPHHGLCMFCFCTFL